MTAQDCTLTRAPKVCVVIPTYNNAGTVADVVVRTSSFVKDIIVVNDGSTDAAARLLEGLPCVETVTHETNRGKGAALRSGLDLAAVRGFTHAITIDADGQHAPEDIPKFLAAIAAHPEAIIVGVRNLTGSRRALKSRLLRANSNFWVWLETGHRAHDTQSGFRAYPLASVGQLALVSERYDFEIEILVKAMWQGVQVVTQDVEARYEGLNVSHFRPLGDFALVSHRNALLLIEKMLLPLSLRRSIHLKEYASTPLLRRCVHIIEGMFLNDADTPGKFASSIGVGVLFGILPIWGFQMAVAAVAAHRLRLNKPLAVAASNISIPVFIPLILYASIITGRLVLGIEQDPVSADDIAGYDRMWRYASEYLVGSVVLAVAMGIVTGLLSFVCAEGFVAFRKGRR